MSPTAASSGRGSICVPVPGFGAVFTHPMGPETAMFVPRGVGNAFQALEPETVYAYLVNQHWIRWHAKFARTARASCPACIVV